jgi:hypothetical protein
MKHTTVEAFNALQVIVTSVLEEIESYYSSIDYMMDKIREVR